MTFLSIFLLALALSVDAFIVSFSYGLVLKKNRAENAFKLGLSTGLGQFLMPIIGWYGADAVHGYIESIDHWISFFVFLALGLKIIADALDDEKELEQLAKSLTFNVLLMIGIATSIDALVTGITIYFMDCPIWFAASAIGFTTFICAIIGYNLNSCFKRIPTKYMEITAGIILIGLGFKVLYEHLSV